jgi:hypothetical protein
MGQLLEDTSPLVRVPALMALGPFLLALPPAEAAADHPPLLAAFAACARVPPLLAAVRVPTNQVQHASGADRQHSCPWAAVTGPGLP